ncbi:MAG: MBL fold metallo-hydrolase [Clostridia bacterium]|nr:MBL fold metallo-hydrolase [Clostridia bacterium]MDE6758458.1 MBL fold metallo-hydrolase [Clostridia bacterium]
MKIEWLGHSCFKLTESTGTTIVADPFDKSIVGFDMASASADVVTCSHQHKDHNAVVRVSGSPLVISECGFWEIKGVDISSMHSYHDEKSGKKRGENCIFKYRMDGVDLCHMGDIGEECTVRLAEGIGSVNVLMIPVGGNYTIDAKQAKEYVDIIMPDIVIPMHFKTSKSQVDIDKVDEFLDLFDEEQIVEIDGLTLEVDRAYFEGDTTKVIVFKDETF